MTRASPYAPPLLEVRALSVGFGAVQAVDDVSFQLESGEILALVGESGSGKSTVALSVLRLLEPAAALKGEVLVAGENLFALPERALRARRGAEIAMVFQDPAGALNPLMTIGEQIGEGLRAHNGLSRRAARLRAIELLDQVHIAEPARRVDSYPHELSGGMKQRVTIAIAISCGPKLLIADEPTTALDASIRGAALELLDQLRRELSLGILLISHDLDLVGEWADRVAVMYAGRICEEGKTDAIFRAPRHPYTRGLLAASPYVSRATHYSAGRLSEIPGVPLIARELAGCAFAPRCMAAEDACRSERPPLIATDKSGSHRLACPVMLGTRNPNVSVAAE